MAPTRTRHALDRDIWVMAWPVMVSYVLNNAVELIDIAMVARLGRDPLAAVGYAAQCHHVVYTILLSVGVGSVALMARSIGAGRPDRAQHAFVASVVSCLIVGVAATTAVALAPGAILGALDAKPHIAALGAPYFQLITLSTILLAITTSHEAGHRAQRDTRTPALVAVLVLAVKGLGNWALVFGAFGFPRLELVGAGIATLVAQSTAVVAYIIVARARRNASVRLVVTRESVAGARSIFRELLAVAAPAVGERLFMSLALLAYFTVLSGYGEAAIAAYAVGTRLLAFSWIPGIAFGIAASTLVGQALGARDRALARLAGWRAVVLGCSVMSVLGIGCFLGRGTLSHLLTPDRDVVDQLLRFMFAIAVAQPFMGAHFTLAGALRGAGATGTPFAASAIGNWAFRVPLAYAAAKVFGLPIIWVWAALVTDHVFRAIWLAIAFKRGRWADRVGATAR